MKDRAFFYIFCNYVAPVGRQRHTWCPNNRRGPWGMSRALTRDRAATNTKTLDPRSSRGWQKKTKTESKDTGFPNRSFPTLVPDLIGDPGDL